jgi:hypothetical protein
VLVSPLDVDLVCHVLQMEDVGTRMHSTQMVELVLGPHPVRQEPGDTVHVPLLALEPHLAVALVVQLTQPDTTGVLDDGDVVFDPG